MKLYQLKLMALNCTKYKEKRDVINVVERLLETEKVVLAERKLVALTDGKMAYTCFRGNTESLINSLYAYRELDESEDELITIRGPELVDFNVLTLLKYPANTEPKYDNIDFSISFTMHTRKYNEVQVICTLIPDDKYYIEPVAQLLLEFARIIYRYLQPYYAWVSHATESFNRLSGEAILARKLQTIYWANFYGPSYVEKFGSDFLISAPGWKKERLEDGGIFLQLTPKFTDQYGKRYQEEMIEYFKAIGVRRVH